MGTSCSFGWCDPELLRDVVRRRGGEDLCEMPFEEATYLWPHGCTMIEACTERRGTVLLRAYIVMGPRLYGELGTDLALFSAGLDFGTLSLDEDGDVALWHRVPWGWGEDYLEAELGAFCSEVDRMGDVLRSRLGGQSSLEVVQQTVGSAFSGRDLAPN